MSNLLLVSLEIIHKKIDQLTTCSAFVSGNNFLV